MRSKYILSSEYLRQHIFVLHHIEYLYANLCEYFEGNLKRKIQICGVCKYTKTGEYEATKIHIHFYSF
jgi:hypothetical protein